MAEAVTIPPPLDFEAPALGRVRAKPLPRVDPLQVERMAALGLKRPAIAANLGIPAPLFEREIAKKQSVLRDAYDRGNARWQLKLATRLDEVVASKNTLFNPAALIFALKQPHGAAWVDGKAGPGDAPTDNTAQVAYEKRKRQRLKLPDAKQISEGVLVNAAKPSP